MVDRYFYSKVLKFQCNNCRGSITLFDLDQKLWDEESYISEIVDNSFTNHVEIETPASAYDWGDFGGGGGAQYIKYELRDTICDCETNHNIRLYVSFLASTPDWKEGKRTSYLEEIEEFLPLTSDSMTFTSDFLILKGEEILNIIHFLFERWVALGYQIEIFCPYITIETCWRPLLKVISKFHSQYHDVAPINIYTRNLQDFRKRTIKQQITHWINKEKKNSPCFNVKEDDFVACYEEPFYKCIHNYGRFLTSNVYSTVVDFHGKYYAGSPINGYSEIALTSFNLTPFQLDQYETFKILNLHGHELSSIRPNLDWEKFVLDDELLRRKVTERFCFNTRVKKYIRSKECGLSRYTLEGDKLNYIVMDIIDKAIARARANGRETVQVRDL